MAVASVSTPIAPPRASISRTICPLATPPIAGLQLIWPTVSQFIVSRAVRRPIRAAARAASSPACPAPTTIDVEAIGIDCFGDIGRVAQPPAPRGSLAIGLESDRLRWIILREISRRRTGDLPRPARGPAARPACTVPGDLRLV